MNSLLHGIKNSHKRNKEKVKIGESISVYMCILNKEVTQEIDKSVTTCIHRKKIVYMFHF